MRLRRAIPADNDELLRLYRERGYTFPFPELSGGDIASIWVAEDEGKLVEAVIARKTVEITALVDPEYRTPAYRLEILLALQELGSAELKQEGFSDKFCWVRPEIRGFGRRLVSSLGWIRTQGGDCYVRGI